MGKDLKPGAIRLAAHDAAFMRIIPVPPFPARHVHALVTDAPVDAAIRAETRAVQIMAGIGDMHAEAMRHDLTHISHAIIVRVFEPPEIRGDGGINPAVVIQNASRDSGDLGVKALCKNGHLIRRAVAVRVAELVDALAVNREVFPVDGAILVLILQGAPGHAQFSGGQLALQELAFFLHTGQANVIGDPHRMLANVQISDFSSRGRRHINPALFIHRAGDGIRHIQRARPAMKGHLGGGDGIGNKKEKSESTHGKGDVCQWSGPGGQRQLNDAGAKLRELDAHGTGGLRQQAAAGHAGDGVDLQDKG